VTQMRHVLHQWQDDGWKEIADLSFVDGWMFPPPWLSESRKAEQIDWGTFRYEVTKDELRGRIRDRPDYSAIKDEWDRPFREREEQQSALLESLPVDGRYAVDWEEGI
jgi:hypothetical protein